MINHLKYKILIIIPVFVIVSIIALSIYSSIRTRRAICSELRDAYHSQLLLLRAAAKEGAEYVSNGQKWENWCASNSNMFNSPQIIRAGIHLESSNTFYVKYNQSDSISIRLKRKPSLDHPACSLGTYFFRGNELAIIEYEEAIRDYNGGMASISLILARDQFPKPRATWWDRMR